MQFELKTRQVCLFFIAFMPLSKLFIMPSIMSGYANEDAWLCATLNLILDFVTFLFVLRAIRNTKMNVYRLLERTIGKTFAKCVLFLYLIYFTLKNLLPLNEQKEYVMRTLYTLTPTLLYFLPFFFVAFYFCTKNLRVIGRTADVLWLVTAIGIIILFCLSFSNIELSALLPIGANGALSVLKGSCASLTWFGDAVYLLFFMGEFKFNKGDGKKIILSFIVSAVAIICFVIVFYTVFQSIAFRQRFALTEISKYSTVINNIGRFDYIGIMMVLFSNLFGLSIPLFFSCKILNYVFSIKKKWISPLIITSLHALIIILFYKRVFSIEQFIMNYTGIFFFIMANVLPIIICLTAKKEDKNAIKES